MDPRTYFVQRHTGALPIADITFAAFIMTPTGAWGSHLVTIENPPRAHDQAEPWRQVLGPIPRRALPISPLRRSERWDRQSATLRRAAFTTDATVFFDTNALGVSITTRWEPQVWRAS